MMSYALYISMDGDLHERLTAFRRELHQYPEIGFEEF